MTAAARAALHVAQIGFFNDPAQRPPAQLLQTWTTLADVAEAACRRVARVSVLQASSHSQELARNGVHYYFLPFGGGARSYRGLAERLHALAPDIFHVHGLGFHREVRSLAALAPSTPIILQDHASQPPRAWRRASWRRGMAAAAAIAFCALEQAEPFRSAGLLPARMRLYEIPESTSRFTPGERAAARLRTGIEGTPAVLWVGHLNANKDPLAVLEGVSAAARRLPQLRLYCCFGVAPLLGAVQERIAADPVLRGRVHLLGRVPHEQVEQLMRAADVFVLGSHHEGSGYALIEALACGLPPAVTDIPSFRALTGAGAVGRLWPCGNSRALGEALLSLTAHADDATRAAVRSHFERELSFDALGAKLANMYVDVIEHHTRTSPVRCAPEDA